MKWMFRVFSNQVFVVFCLIIIFQFILTVAVSASPVNSINRDTTAPVPPTSFFVSNSGSNSNDGKSDTTAKLSLGSLNAMLATPSAGDRETVIALEKNSIFREEFLPVSNIKLGSFGRRNEGLPPKITGMDIIRDWTLTAAAKNVYENLLTHSIELNNPNYSYIIVAEIDTVIEKTNPIAAVKYLPLMPGIEACDGRPGSYYIQALLANPIKVYIHPTTGVPGQNRFRYEATTRKYAISGNPANNATYENLFLQSSGNGYGMLSGGDNIIARNIIFQGGGTHHFVVKSGTVDSCTFYPGPKGLKDRIAAIFYEAQGTGNINRLTNSTFLDIPTPLYTHTDGAVNHQSLTVDHVYAFGDSTDAVQALSSADTDSVTVSNCYAENYPVGWYGIANKLSISNSIFRNTNQAAIHLIQPKAAASEVNISNVLIKSNGNNSNQDINDYRVVYGVRSDFGTRVNISNSIIHGRSTWNYNGQFSVYTLQVSGPIKANYNIYICDVNDNNGMHITRTSTNGTGTASNIQSDSNVYIVLRGQGFHWYVDAAGQTTSVFTLSQWQAMTGQDKNSIFIDLRNNDAGLKAVFKDPENGDWNLTSSPIASSIAKLGAGITNAPLYYPQRPAIGTDYSFKTPGGFSSFSGLNPSPKETILNWQTFNENDYSYFVIENSTDGVQFTQIDTLGAAGLGLSNKYEYVDAREVPGDNYYRLKIFRKDMSFFYSQTLEFRKNIIPTVKLQIYPNPFQQIVTVDHPSTENAAIHVYDLGGKLVGTFKVPPGVVRTPLDLGNLKRGMYVIKWAANGYVFTSRVIKLK